MEFACSHVVCRSPPTWQPPAPGGGGRSHGEGQAIYGKVKPKVRINHDYDNPILRIPTETPGAPINPQFVQSTIKNIPGAAAPPVPPRFASKKPALPASSKQTRPEPWSLTPPPLPHRTFRSASPSPSSEVNVNVVSLQLGKMAAIKDEALAALAQNSSAPVLCGSCSAALSAISKMHRGQGGTMWICEFCHHPNCISASSWPTQLLQDAIYVPPSQRDSVNVEDALIVFCVDISGSMSVTSEVKDRGQSSKSEYVSRLQCVKNAIMRSLSFLRLSSPRRRVALVTFNDEVMVFGDGLCPPLTLCDYELMDLDYLRQQGQLYPVPRCIAETLTSLSRRVHEMREHGATALGPAAIVAIEMASQQAGSKVIICTDGLANTGLGFLDSTEDELYQSGKYFYSNLAETASALGVIVSVLTFEGTDCRLAEVGKLADRTGGRVDIVNPSNLSCELQAILEDDVMATNMKMHFFIAKDMYFRYEDQEGNKLVKEIGNVTKDAEVTFEFGIKETNSSPFHQGRRAFPFQLQVEFRTRDQMLVRRIVSQEKHIATNRSLVEDSINIAVLGVHAAQLSARLTMEGRGQEAQRDVQARADFIRNIVEKKQNKEDEDIYENWMSTVASICEDLTGPCEFAGGAGNMDPTNKNSVLKVLSDEMMNVVFKLKNAKSKMLRKPNGPRTPPTDKDS